MIEILAKAASAAKEGIGKGITEKSPWNNTGEVKKSPEAKAFVPANNLNNPSGLSDKVLTARCEAAAHSASKFFDMPDAQMVQGKSIGVEKGEKWTMTDDRFQYNLDQFKKMGCTSFEDMSKIWSHECGHRMLQNIFPNSWVDELGADFFCGARSEMLGLPKSNVESYLAKTKPSESHPGGELRMRAMDFGRQTVAEMQRKGIKPTWQNCIKVFSESPFAKMDYTAGGNERALTGFVNDRTYQLNKADSAKRNADYYNKLTNSAIKNGNLSAAKRYSSSAKMYENRVNSAVKDAKSCTKFIDDANEVTGFVNDRTYNLNKADSAKRNADYYNKLTNIAIKNGNLSAAKRYSSSAKMYENRVNSAVKDAKSSTKFVDDTHEITAFNRAGGSYGELKGQGWGWNSKPMAEVHHMPSKECSYLSVNDGPAIVMEYSDHLATASWGRSKDAVTYRKRQKELVDAGKFHEAMRMDIDDVRSKFGNKYDGSIEAMLIYVNNKKI